MKKILLIILILPLTLMARPEKKYISSGEVAHLYGSINWPLTSPTWGCVWIWGNTGSTPVSSGGTDGCDDTAREKTGKYNITDITCTDGIAGGCDGAYPKIKFSKLLKGTYVFNVRIPWHCESTNTQCSIFVYDGNDYYRLGNMYQSANDDIVIPLGASRGIVYTEDQGETTFELYAAETGTCNVYLGDATGGIDSAYKDFTIDVYYFPLSPEESPNRVIFK